MLRRLYDWTVDKAAHPHAEWWLALVAFLEASFFPVPPHPLLGLMCLAQPKKALRYAVIATGGSVLGGLLGYTIGYFLYDSVGTQLLALLHLSDSFPRAACYLREYGVEIIVIKGATPIPFKLITLTAGFIGMPLIPFILASIVSRAISFVSVGLLFRIFGAPIKRFIDKYLGLVTIGVVAIIVSGFVAAAMLGGGGSDSSSEKCNRPAALIAKP
jgi:membrane protein YqaA with SNARE-associated domain